MQQEMACLNGRLLPADEAHVSVHDAGFMQGIGLFETMRAYGGRVFRLERHLDRLANSAEQLGWSRVPDHDVLREHVDAVMSASAGQDARVRLTVTTGSLRAAAAGTPQLTIVATATAGGKYPADYYAQGVEVAIARFRQSRFDPLAGHKTTGYFGRLASLREAHGKGALEAIWLTDAAFVAEGAMSNIFAVRDGRVLTPALEAAILPGITRATVIELCSALSIPLEEGELTVEQLKSSTEIFLTNSMMEVMPVVRVDRDAVHEGRPGGITRRLAAAYGECVARECGV